MDKRRSLDDTCDVFLTRQPCELKEVPFHEFSPHLAAMTPSTWYDMQDPAYMIPPKLLEHPKQVSSIAPSVRKRVLPEPGCSDAETLSKPARSFNARRHIPRPRNPFILFRCDFIQQRKMQAASETDGRNVSRVAGEIWREMTPEEKQPWLELAIKEKERHALLYPEYKYTPNISGTKGKKGKNDFNDESLTRDINMLAVSFPHVPLLRRDARPVPKIHTRRDASSRPRPYPQPLPERRSSSCPPVGAVPVPDFFELQAWTPPLATQDDMRRRPSRTVMYQSVTPRPIAEPVIPSFHLPDLQHGDVWSGLHAEARPIESHDVCLSFNPQLDKPDSTGSLVLPMFDTSTDPMFSLDFSDLNLDELYRLENLTLEPTFTNPFGTSATFGADGPFHPLPMDISPLDFSNLAGPSSNINPSTAASSN